MEHEPILMFDEQWGVGRLPNVYGIGGDLWVALHFCGTNGRYGWHLRRKGWCSRCKVVFPHTIIGMRNMLNGLD